MRKAVLVTTNFRGVFFGWLDTDEQPETDRTLVLHECRNAIYWTGAQGFLGLAAAGPEPQSRIGSVAPRVLLHEVTSVTDCTPAATEKWTQWP